MFLVCELSLLWREGPGAGAAKGAGMKTIRVLFIQVASAELGRRGRVMNQESAEAMGSWAEVGGWQPPPISALLGL